VTKAFVRALKPADWPMVEAIYAEGIATGHATFEAEPLTWDDFDAGKLASLRFVAIEGGEILGWAAASATSARAVYRGVVEHSVYVTASARGRGIGHSLLDALIPATEAEGIWTIQSSVFPENAASLTLHAGHGFSVVGRREDIAKMTYGPLAGAWRDTILTGRVLVARAHEEFHVPVFRVHQMAAPDPARPTRAEEFIRRKVPANGRLPAPVKANWRGY
jgi:L-amino acid N-acyltransferase YncA